MAEDAANKNTTTTKVAFSLGKKKKKQPPTSTVVDASEFGQVTQDSSQKIVKRRTEPLVIPLPEGNRNSLLPSTTKHASISNNNNNNNKSNNNNINDEKKDNVKPSIDNTTNDAGKEETQDDKAAKALIQQAANHFDQKDTMAEEGATNFSAKGEIVIASKKDTFKDEEQQFQNDLNDRPTEIPVESDVYDHVPIREFGAAMLRGMGWTGGNNHNKSKKDDTMSLPRPHRLGLGATPKLMSTGPKGGSSGGGPPKMLRPDQLKRQQLQEQQQEEYELKRQEQLKHDKQRTLQNGSIVRVVVVANDHQENDNPQPQQRRAKMIQLRGVPGLNRVLVQYERQNQTASVKRGDVQLMNREELNDAPFTDTPLESSRTSQEKQQSQKNEEEERNRKNRRREGGSERDEYGADRRRSRREDDYDDRRRSRREDEYGADRRRSRREEEYDDDRRRSSRRDDESSSRRRRDREDDERKRRRRRDEDDDDDDDDARSSSKRKSSSRDDDNADYYRDSKRTKKGSSTRQTSEHHNNNNGASERWLLPNIRVRVISKKYGSHSYKQKGLVLDVTHGGAFGTLQMASEVLDKVADRHLETALPKVGGNAIVLTGPHKFAKGQLMERSSKTGKGIIQVFEDMSLVTLSLDDIAEWCGPLDDDMMG